MADKIAPPGPCAEPSATSTVTAMLPSASDTGVKPGGGDGGSGGGAGGTGGITTTGGDKVVKVQSSEMAINSVSGITDFTLK